MCTTAAVLGAIAAAGGTYLQYDSQKDAQEAQRKAAQAEAMRQSNLDKEKFTNFQEALAMAERDTQQGQIDKATTELEEEYTQNANAPSDANYTSPAVSGGPKVVREYGRQRSNEAQDFLGLLGNARARSNAWGENNYAFGQGLLDRQFDLGRLQTGMNRSAQIGQQEILQAGQEGQGKGAFGNALAGLGMAGLTYGAGQGAFDGIGDLFKGGAKPSVVTATPAWTRNAVTTPLKPTPLYKGVNI